MKILDEISNVKVYKTTNYEQFWNIKGNRNIIQNHLKELTLSIMHNNLLSYNPIIVTEDKGIIDGQHRLIVAKNNRLPIFYIIAVGANIDQVRQLNKYNKNWNGLDFITSYAVLGNEQYQWILAFIEEYTISVSVALHLIFGENKPALVKTGLLNIHETVRKRSEKRANTLISIRPFLTKSGSIPKGFVSAINKITDEDKEKKILDGIAKVGSIYPKLAIREAYHQLLSFIS